MFAINLTYLNKFLCLQEHTKKCLSDSSTIKGT